MNIEKKNDQRYLILFIFVLLITAIGFSIYYSFYTGVYTLPFEHEPVVSYDIRLAETNDFEIETSKLNAQAHVDPLGVTYSSIKLDEIIESDGKYIDNNHTYLAYSFFIINLGTTNININYYLRVIEVMNGMDEFIRILVIEDDLIYTLYQKEDHEDDLGQFPSYEGLPDSTNFVSPNMVFNKQITDLQPNEVKSFRVVLWIESKDPDLTNTFTEGTFKTHMVFSIRLPHQELRLSNMMSDNKEEHLWVPAITICSVGLDITSGSYQD